MGADAAYLPTFGTTTTLYLGKDLHCNKTVHIIFIADLSAFCFIQILTKELD